jgi:hypothetical protein
MHAAIITGLWASSAVRNSKHLTTQSFGNWICFRLQVMGRRHLLCRVPQKELTNLKHWVEMLVLSKGHNRVGVTLSSHEDENLKFSVTLCF